MVRFVHDNNNNNNYIFQGIGDEYIIYIYMSKFKNGKN